MSSKYAETGVDVKKKGIEVFKSTISSLFPEAFCVITADPDMPGYGLVTHSDEAGSKVIQAYLHWKETSNFDWFSGSAQDVLAMNLGDIICVGAKPINFVDYVALNPFRIPKIGLLSALNSGFKGCFETLEKYGIRILFSGGETGELADPIRTLDVSGTINGRVELSKVITGADIRPGDVIIGLRSGGKTKYETSENSGIMCNGLTLARSCLMSRSYQEKYPEIVEAERKGYYGRFKFDDYVDGLTMSVGEALLSPTRFYAPVVLRTLEKHRLSVSGLVHNTGGGQTKCLRIGRNINYIKDDLIEPDPLFHLIQKESGESWEDMFQNFNMGTGFEIMARPEIAEEIIDISESFKLEAKVIGRCEKSDGKNKVTIKSPFGKFQYE